LAQTPELAGGVNAGGVNAGGVNTGKDGGVGTATAGLAPPELQHRAIVYTEFQQLPPPKDRPVEQQPEQT